MVYVLLGPSGSGKTSLGRECGLKELISHTTRGMRPGEIDGVTYHYITDEEFKKIDKIEETEYDGRHYCLATKELHNKIDLYGNAFVIIDKNGIDNLYKNYVPGKIKVIYITAPFWQIVKRLYQRDGFIKMIRRIFYAIITGEFWNHKFADKIITNKDGYFLNSVSELRTFIERTRDIGR
ncbi:MAG: hypothetical protein ACOCRO_00760 [Halanaerobiales bacterium]